ncbi:LCP family protein [Paenibacillus sp. ACRRX]|uniref:LCP family glycopolymer transferase n=1 Tax=Paenibacillus sp. ACRRX TaxID=2918206 RepID=UPI001EF45D6F|nr:LCP family protein [Paenibacillus sp. ACRRX]MCG7408981.1 LCP family protein [Paenibacillus sp. ACRRX]
MIKIWNRWRPWHKVVFIVMTALLLVTAAVGGTLWYKLRSTANAMYEPLPPRKLVPLNMTKVHNGNKSANKPVDTSPLLTDPSLNEGQPFTVLILGVDERKGDVGRSDSMAIAVINPKSGRVTMVSIPRDTLTKIVGRNKEDKINHAYAFGGVAMSVASVEGMFQIPIHYYVKTNMEGFQTMIDTIGGVEVKNQFPFELDGVHFAQGDLHLAGYEALAYVRMRKQDPNGDFGRMDRQREVLQSVLKRAASLQGMTHWTALLDTMKNYIKTNFRFEDWQNVMVHYMSTLKEVEKIAVQGRSARINGIYYWLVDDQERVRIHELLRNKLEQSA